MALNTDFKVKDSLYVGNSACFVSQTNTPVILSAGSSLFDIFLQEGEVATNQPLRAGVDGGITSFSYDGSTSQTISISSTLSAKWDEAYNWCNTYSGTTLSAATWVANNGCGVIDGGSSYTQGTITLSGVDDTVTTIDTGLQTGDSPTFGGVTAGCIQVGICTDNTLDTADGNLTIDSAGGTTCITDNLCVTTGSLNVVDGQILSGGNDLFTIFSEGDITAVCPGSQMTGGGSSGDVTLNVSLSTGGVGAGDYGSDAAGTKINQISVDEFGRITNVTTGSTGTGDIDGLCLTGGLSGTSLTSGTVCVGIDSATAANFSCQGIVTCLSDGTAISVDNCDTANPTINVASACNTAWNNTYQWCTNNSGTVLSAATWVATNGDNVYDTVSSTLQGAFTATDIANNLDAVDLGLTPADSPIFYAMSAITVSGDGSGLTGVTATPSFPTTSTTDLGKDDKIFVNDDAGCAVSGNKHITLSNFLSDIQATGLSAGPDTIGVCGADDLTTNTLSKWSGTGFVDSLASETTTTFTIAGSAVVQGDLTVEGNLTCLDTLISVTSAIEICNHGTGPALYAEQSGANCVIACFVDTEGGSIVFDNGGNVGIGETAPGEKLTVIGAISATENITTRGNIVLSDTCTVDGRDVSADGLALDSVYTQFNSLSGGVLNHLAECAQGVVTTYNLSGGTCDVSFGLETSDSPTFAGVTGGNVQVGVTGDNEIDTSSGNLTIDSNGGTTIIDDALRTTGGAVFVSTLSAAGATTIEDNLTIGAQSGTIGSSTIQMTASALDGEAGAYSKQQSFMTYVDSNPTSVSTFTKTVNSRDIKQMKYLITLKKGVNITSFEVNAVYNGTAPCGTTYGIVDAQAASQLDTISIVGSGSDIELFIGAASDDTDAIIHGTALY